MANIIITQGNGVDRSTYSEFRDKYYKKLLKVKEQTDKFDCIAEINISAMGRMVKCDDDNLKRIINEALQ